MNALFAADPNFRILMAQPNILAETARFLRWFRTEKETITQLTITTPIRTWREYFIIRSWFAQMNQPIQVRMVTQMPART